MNDSGDAQALGRDQLDIHTPVQVCEWQDMVSAPLDTEVLVSDGEAIAVARVHVTVCQNPAFTTVVYGTASNLCPVRKPTHWMSLPLLPSPAPLGHSAGYMYVRLP